ncbi:hypothetical protein BFP97_17925 [Roseivirga sp. 4D4]|uniref:PHP domain-containing protein n=1 Tax=Roseivirga sp. 4D4 TaxID=1889784 RepID=UPI000852A1BB|nr:PHP domain-containing protein [Roseivirga sp. 4D4]OEK03289.1 hypothetical protein BFP97_17925 [Roseivirga sp. 4D4]
MKKNTRNLLNGILALSIAGGVLMSNQKAGDEFSLYFGLLHAHTAISDGSGTPEEAYDMAKSHGLDFFAVTPHNHKSAEFGAKADRKDGVLIANDNALYNGSSVKTVTQKFASGNKELKVKPLLMAARDATDDDFLAIYGQEFSAISKGNHMNVLGIDEVIKAGNGNFNALVDRLDQLDSPPILQLNHPNVQQDLFYSGNKSSTKENMFNDYGIDAGDLGPHFSTLISKLDKYVHLIEIFSGPAMQKARKENHHDKYPHHNDYFFYLKQGFHISPSAGQDNHYKTWGMATDIRTGVFAKDLTQESVFEAFRGQRTFASEDANASVKLNIGDTFMGSNMSATIDQSLKIEVLIQDPDEDKEEAIITVYGGLVEAEDSKKATNVKQSSGRLIEETVEIGTRSIVLDQTATGDAEFYYVVVEQQDGDRIYSAPIWVNHPKKNVNQDQASIDQSTKQLFVWTKNKRSKVYHLKNCPSTQLIKDTNRQSGYTAPTGRVQHNCKIESEGN